MRSVSRRAFVASPPTIRIARPGPGKGWRQTSRSGSPSSAPTARTSSLNSARSGSTRSNSRSSGQAADVVVGLDRRGAGAAAGLDHVGVERALDEEGGALELGRLLLEDADELRADRLALGLGLGQPAEAREEAVLGVDGDERHLEVVAEGGDDLLALVLAHQAVVDEHARQLVADRAVHEQRGDGGVDPAREPADDAAAADLGADALDLLLDDRGRAPGARAAADLLEERRQHVLAVGRVDDLGVELDAVEAALDVLERGDRRLRRAGELAEARAAPSRRCRGATSSSSAPPACRPAAGPGSATVSCERPNSPTSAPSTLPPSVEHERLHAVTDAEHRDPELQQLRIEPRRALRVDGRRAAGEDQALRAAPAHLLHADVVRQQLGEHAALAHAARDQLRVLPAVVEDDDLVGRDLALERELLEGLVRRDGGPVPLGAKLSRRQARPRSTAHPCRSAGRAGAACPPSAGTARSSAPRG